MTPALTVVLGITGTVLVLNHYLSNQSNMPNNGIASPTMPLPATAGGNATHTLGMVGMDNTTGQFILNSIAKDPKEWDNFINSTRTIPHNSNATQVDFHQVVDEGNITEVKNFLRKIDDFKEQDKKDLLNSVLNGTTALGKAIEQGSGPIVKLLIQQPQIDINKTGKDKFSLLLALMCQKPEIAKILLTQSGNNGLNVRDSLPGSNISPLHQAIIHNYVDIVSILLKPKYNIDVNSRDTDGHTILHYAVKLGRVDIVKFLLGLDNIDINAKDNDGITAQRLAEIYGHAEIVELLQAAQA